MSPDDLPPPSGDEASDASAAPGQPLDSGRPSGGPPWARGRRTGAPQAPGAPTPPPAATDPTAAGPMVSPYGVPPAGSVPPPGVPPAVPAPGVPPAVPSGYGQPAAPFAAVPTAGVIPGTPPGWSGDLPGTGAARPRRKFVQGASTPLWWFLGAFGLLVATYVVPAVVFVSAFEDWDPSSEVLPERAGAATFLFFALALLAMGAWLMCLIRIGANAGTFGPIVPLHAMFPIWILLAALGGEKGILLGIVLYYLWPIRLLVTGIWTAGRLPPVVALIGWVPSTLWAASLLIDNGTYYDPNDTVLAIQAVLGVGALISGLFNVGSVIAVVVIQHVGIAQDRANLANWRPPASDPRSTPFLPH